MVERRRLTGARCKLSDASRIAFATAAVALLVAGVGAAVNWLASTHFAAGSLATIGLCYLALGLWNLSWRVPKPRSVFVEWHRPAATRDYRVTTHSPRPWEQN